MPQSVKAVVFDMDGTITVPVLDFPRMKAEIGAPPDQGLLESISLMDNSRRAAAEEILLRHERAAALDSTLNPGVEDALASIASMGLAVAILTRNSRRSVEIVLDKHSLAFNAVVTREDSLPKPDPDGVIVAAWRMGVAPASCIMVGDFEFDIISGRAAGALTVLYSPQGRTFQTVPDFEIRSMGQLPPLLRELT